MPVSVALALTPVLLVAWLLLIRRATAEAAGGAGLLAAALIAFFHFDTAPVVIGASALSGVIGSLPVGLVLAASLFQMLVMQQSGALARIVVFVKGLVPGQKAVQALLVNMAFGVLLTSLGAATVSIIPPILLALGYSAFAAILLPALGYTAMCIYALLGIPAVVFAGFTGLSLHETGVLFARYTPLVSLAVGLCTLYAAGGARLVREGISPAIMAALAGGGTCVLMSRLGLVTITGIVAGAAMAGALLLYAAMRGLPLFRNAASTPEDREAERRFSLWRACSPWLALTGFSLAINAPFLPFFQLVFRDWAMPATIVPGAPEYIRPFWQAYFWVAVSTFVCLPLLRVSRAQLRAAAGIFCRRAWRIILSTAVFFALAYVMNHSGKNAAWVLPAPDNNMIDVLALGAAALFGSLYPAITPGLGLLAGFVSGSQTSAVAMFTKLHMTTAENLGVAGPLLAAASAVGGGIAGVVSPAKILAAAASIDRPEEAPAVMRVAFILALIITCVCAAMTCGWL